MKIHRRTSLRLVLASGLLATGACLSARAEDPPKTEDPPKKQESSKKEDPPKRDDKKKEEEKKDEAPRKIAGTWTWKWTDAQGQLHSHTLDVEGEGKDLKAQERFDDEKSVKVDDLKLDGKTIKFAVNRGDRRSLYKGEVASDDTINGTVEVTIEGQPSEFGWTAKKKADAAKAK